MPKQSYKTQQQGEISSGQCPHGLLTTNLREFACLTTVILAPLRMEGGLHAGSATSLPVVPLVPLANSISTFTVCESAPNFVLFEPNRCFWLRIISQKNRQNTLKGTPISVKKVARCVQISSSLSFSCGLRSTSMRFWLPNASPDSPKVQAF